MLRKAFLIIGSVLLVVVAGGAVFVAARQNLRFDPAYPDITASADSAIVERGRYIVRDVAPCASCQLLPFMEMQGLSGRRPAGRRLLPARAAGGQQSRSPSPLHRARQSREGDGAGETRWPSATPPARAPRALGVETGRYLVESVALCWACHTERSQMTGALTGPRFGGTTGFTESDDPTHTWSPPNITSDAETGRLGKLTEDQFVARFRQGRILPGSPMPWRRSRG